MTERENWAHLGGMIRSAVKHLVDMTERSANAMFYTSGIRDAWDDVNELLAELPLMSAALSDARAELAEARAEVERLRREVLRQYDAAESGTLLGTFVQLAHELAATNETKPRG